MHYRLCTIIAAVLTLLAGQTFAQAVPVSAPLTTDSAGIGGPVATGSVFRVLCQEGRSLGTGFLHKSGRIITAAHVVRGCSNVLVFLPDNTAVAAVVEAGDEDFDLAILKPSRAIMGQAFPIADHVEAKVGAQVTTWGFPGGYDGIPPLLSVGYLSGATWIQTASGKRVFQWMVNAAFNHGNSGGPLIDVSSGQVVGVVVSKVAPLSLQSRMALAALQTQHSGVMYEYTDEKGAKTPFSEAQVVGWVLSDLQDQVQLVIGQAVPVGDLQSFLRGHGVEP